MRAGARFSTWPPAEDVPAFRGQGAEGRRCAVKMLVVMAVLIALATAVGHLLGDSTGVDRAVSDWFVDRRTSAWNAVTRWFSKAADTLIVVTIGLVVLVTGFLRKSRNGLIILVVGMFGEVLMFLAMTALVSRPRPEVEQLDSAPPTSSFPSGHTFASVVLWSCIAVVAHRSEWPRWIQRLVFVLAVLIPLSVATSRLYRGMHHLTDVSASILLGCLWMLTILRLFPLQRVEQSDPARPVTQASPAESGRGS